VIPTAKLFASTMLSAGSRFMFEGFQLSTIETAEASIRVRHFRAERQARSTSARHADIFPALNP
jgi:hypothetical protein